MKVYVVMHNLWDESWIEGVFSSCDEAENYVETRPNYDEIYEESIGIQEWELDSPNPR